MAAGTTPVFVATPKTWYGQVSVANTAYDGTGTIVTIATGVANASIIQFVRVHASVTTTAGMVRFFLTLDGGTTKRLILEIPISAVTVAANTAAFSDERVFTVPLVLPDTNGILYASTHNAEAINIVAVGGDF